MLFQDVLVVHPEFVPLVMFSQKYWVPAGFPLAVQLALMLVWVMLEKPSAPGRLARVYAYLDPAE